MQAPDPQELATLTFGLAGALLLVRLVRNSRLPGFRLFFIATGFIVAAYWFTVLEGYFWGRLLNMLEHLFIALAGITMAVALARFRGRARSGAED